MICWFGIDSNNVGMNVSFIYFKSSISSRPSGIITCKNNFRESVALYIARNREIILTGFTLHDDVYLAPKQLY